MKINITNKILICVQIFIMTTRHLKLTRFPTYLIVAVQPIFRDKISRQSRKWSWVWQDKSFFILMNRYQGRGSVGINENQIDMDFSFVVCLKLGAVKLDFKSGPTGSRIRLFHIDHIIRNHTICFWHVHDVHQMPHRAINVFIVDKPVNEGWLIHCTLPHGNVPNEMTKIHFAIQS